MLSKIFLCLVCLSLASASPLLQAREDFTRESLENEFQGIWWKYAFGKNDDGTQECSTDKITTLVTALRTTKGFMALAADTSRKDITTDGAWHHWYIRPNPDSNTIIVTQDWNYNDAYKATLARIQSNVGSASSWPFNGKPNGSHSSAQRVSIRCKEVLPNGYKPCSQSKLLPAYTSPPSATEANTWMTFCDLFFDSSIKTLDDETSKGPKKSSELYALRTREHILAHEFFHCDIFGFSPTHIDDLSDPAVDGPVYGGSRCSDYGWLHVKDSPSTVNMEADENADTYAWWITSVWFQKKWNWPYDTSSGKRQAWTDVAAIDGYDDGTRNDGEGVLPIIPVTVVGPAPVAATPPPAAAPAVTCTVVPDPNHPPASMCNCSDGSHPQPDEDNRCCIYGNGENQCFH